MLWLFSYIFPKYFYQLEGCVCVRTEMDSGYLKHKEPVLESHGAAHHMEGTAEAPMSEPLKDRNSSHNAGGKS